MLNEWEVFNIKRVVPVHIQLTTTMEQDGQRDQYHLIQQIVLVRQNGIDHADHLVPSWSLMGQLIWSIS